MRGFLLPVQAIMYNNAQIGALNWNIICINFLIIAFYCIYLTYI
jgi:hypothetical protein